MNTFKPYTERYFSQPKYYAQDQLQGRTHYVDDDTLRYFYARINSAYATADGLLFCILESSAADPNNRSRITRGVVFDVFGNPVYRPNIDESFKTGDQARKAMKQFLDGFDAVEHTRDAIFEKADRMQLEAARMVVDFEREYPAQEKTA